MKVEILHQVEEAELPIKDLMEELGEHYYPAIQVLEVVEEVQVLLVLMVLQAQAEVLEELD